MKNQGDKSKFANPDDLDPQDVGDNKVMISDVLQ